MQKDMKKKQNVKARIWLILGILLIGYYGIEALFVGFTFSLLWIWAAMGAVCLLCAALTFRFGRLPLPKWLFTALCVLLALGVILFCIVEGFVISQMQAEGEENLDYIIVLGARVNRNGVPSKPLYWRIDAAEEYLRENPDTRAVLSGGKGADEPMSEAQCMYDALIARGIDGSRLILEDKSTSTGENIRFSLALIGSDTDFGIVTNNFHVYRAVKIAEKLSGNEVSGIASQYKDALIVHYMAREVAGILVDDLRGNLDFWGK